MKKLPVFTLGVEEEYQIIDPQTRDLRSHLSKIVDGAKSILKEQVKAEMHQSVVEVGTNICKNVKEANDEIRFLRSKIVELAHKQNLVVGGAGTHPFSRWQDQPITDDPRYHTIVNELQDAARSNLIFGMHCHVGIENRDIGLQLMNQACYFLPHIFALSTNSPFWEGRNTGYKSFRTKVFDKFPWMLQQVKDFDFAGAVQITLQYVLLGAKTTFIAVGGVVFALIIGIYLAVDADYYFKGTVRAFPPRHRGRAQEVLKKCSHVVRVWFRAQLIDMAIIGLITTLGLWIVGVKYWALFGLLTAILGIIPYVGVMIVVVVVSVITLATDAG
jgi:gamma-glutamylcysteine synthetase